GAAAGVGGRVRIRVTAEAGALLVSVCNDGRHISAQQMEQLFEPFSPGEASGEGTGLGLWVSYQIVQQMEGQIDVRSDVTETCFTVRLPLRFGGGGT
ncbi:MAG: HAMP domain-containing histidine kinase, partial [Ectothiorhodospiraceae bacterium]|nr:HAMP domain-containing histidine kinase [Ectothiorhodospiraceae bacterium]